MGKQESRQQHISLISFLVRSYDEAIDFFTHSLGFQLVEDTPLTGTKRWVRVCPPGNPGFCLLLARAEGAEQESRIGNQTGGRVFLFLQTDDFWRDYKEMSKQGVQFLETPREEVYGRVAVFVDLYGNKWDLIEPF